MGKLGGFDGNYQMIYCEILVSVVSHVIWVQGSVGF